MHYIKYTLIELIDKDFFNNIVNESTTIVVNNDSAYNFIDKILNKEVNLIQNVISSSDMVTLSHSSFKNNKFEDIAYAEPMYVKKPYVN